MNSNFTQNVGQPRDYPNGIIKSVVNVDKNQEVSHDGLNVGEVEGVLEEPPLINMALENEEFAGLVEGRRMINDAISYSSSTKTMTAQLSGNGYSEEMRKINRLRHVQLRMNQVADLEVEVNKSESCPVPRDSDVSAPPGSDMCRGPTPPEFDGPASPLVSKGRVTKTSQRPTDPTAGSRVTRSQMKKGKKKVAKSPSKGAKTNSALKGVVDSPLGRKSIETSDSMLKLAEDALRVGELLGIKVISHKDKVVKRLTDSIKSHRGARSIRDRH